MTKLNHKKFLSLISLLLTIFLSLITNWANALSIDNDVRPNSVLLQADEINHTETTNIINALGNVELSLDNRVLLADQISFNQKTGQVIASNNVILLEENGDVLFSDSIELSNEFKRGFIKNLKLRMKDGSRLAANSAEFIKDERKIMHEVTFSPCLPCEKNPQSPLIWQIKADKVIHNEKTENMEYQDATFEFFDIPIFFTPYFIHPDPTVERRSGLLPPTQGYSESKGFIYGQPYFLTLGSSKDLEIKPTIYTRDGVTLQSRYRHAFFDGLIDSNFTLGVLSDTDGMPASDNVGVDGSISIKSNFSLNETWRAKVDIEQASDKTYYRKYISDDKEILRSHLLLEGFRDRNYLAIEGYKFQGLRSTDARDGQPIVSPAISYSFSGDPGPHGETFKFDVNFDSIFHQQLTDSRNLSILAGWQIPYYSPSGEIYSLTTSLQSNLYFTSKGVNTSLPLTSNQNEIATRVFPQLALNWRYPFFRKTKNSLQFFEPIVNLVIAPNAMTTSTIPMEDSQGFEFDDTNIFRINRYTGSERITEGSRIDYGINGSILNNTSLTSEIFIGQGYRFGETNSFALKSGLEDNLTDIVGRVFLSPSDWLNLNYRFRLDKDNLTPRRSEFGVAIRDSGYNVSVDYVLLDEYISTETFDSREQVSLEINTQLDEQWLSSFSLTQDLTNSSNGTRKAALNLTYSDECFTLGLGYERKDFSLDGIESDNQVFLIINLKKLGSI